MELHDLPGRKDPFEQLMDGLAAKLGAEYAAEVAAMELTKEDLIDPTGTPLTPSWHGCDCLGNGQWPGYECCCDECNFYLNCFPDWEE